MLTSHGAKPTCATAPLNNDKWCQLLKIRTALAQGSCNYDWIEKSNIGITCIFIRHIYSKKDNPNCTLLFQHVVFLKDFHEKNKKFKLTHTSSCQRYRTRSNWSCWDCSSFKFSQSIPFSLISFHPNIYQHPCTFIQNATQTLMMRYSRGILNESYNPTMAVIATECCKFSVCTILIAIGIGESGLAASHHSIASKGKLSVFIPLIFHSDSAIESPFESLVIFLIYLCTHCTVYFCLFLYEYPVVHLVGNSGYTWVPATCYFLQNSLQYVASENLSSSVFAVLQQMKILSAALASVFILGRHLMWR